MTLNLMMPQQDELKPRITVFGVGGAGGNAVNNMIEKQLDGVEFVVANTDAQALQQSRAPAKVQMGVKVTEGLGAGARPSVGAAAAEETIEEIVDHLAGAHMCFITAGMGGGTGTGAAPIIAQAARELGVLTVGVVTKPFQFEGGKRMRQAEDGVEALQKMVDTLIIIPNQNLFRLANEKTTFTEAFALADDVLYQGVKGVTDLMVRPGLINLDFADVRAVMDEMGKAMMGTGEAEGEDRAQQAAEKAIANPLLDEISLNGAKGVLINVTGGHDLTLFELDEAANVIRDKVDSDANIIVGSTLDEGMSGRMRVSVVATGIDTVKKSGEEPGPRRRMAEPLAAPREEAPQQPQGQGRGEVYAAEPQRDWAASGRSESFHDRETQRRVDPQTEMTEDDDGGLPAPAYRPEPAQPAAEAPQPRRAAGYPSPEAMERLQAAVQKAPSAGTSAGGQSANPGQGHETPNAGGSRLGGGINSLINRMTGHPEQGGERAAHGQAAAARRQAPPVRRYEEEPDMSPEEERIEIPAFLRRQAN
ncbi:cell division protein FtsZ [Profundibacterium mesophilum]|uniref:Cell division protein FtsZ n=1 Tax=Profundibacterium mesophilum KAUST100406-0324 TaxID=1037889 RepID=A0A921TCA7_9RHOB|nr:cell division protein FtsZ [Profundibacterium mesophilum]KAF0675463.1 Cell division protein FtsZ [Profundibacterium mesophilum KAUST100406-0324]